MSLIAITIGTARLRATRTDARGNTRGFVLLVVGLWMLFSLGYFAGRSFTSALFAGLGIQLGILLAVLSQFAWEKLGVGWPKRSRLLFTGSVALALIPTFFGMTLIFGGSAPQQTLAFGLSGDPVVDFRSQDFDEVRSAIERVSLQKSDEETYLIVGPSAVTSTIAEMEDGASMSRIYLGVSRMLMDLQCKRLPSDGFLVVEEQIADRFESLKVCSKRLNPVGADVTVVPGLDVRIFELSSSQTQDVRRVTQ